MSIDYCIRDPLDEPKYNIEYYDIHSGKMVKYYDVNENFHERQQGRQNNELAGT